MKYKIKTILVNVLFFLMMHPFYSQNKTENIQKFEQEYNQTCGTEVPSQQWESKFQELIKQFIENKSNNKLQSQLYTIPVIIHVVHGGQALGTYPNLAQGQINSQIRVLNDDYGGIGFNSNNYPATAFTAYALSQSIPQANLDGLGRIQIANCNIQFCLATKDTLGNLLAEPGIDRINYVTKGWTNPGSFTSNTALQNYVNATIKPQTIWNVSKYLNIWLTDLSSSASLLGYATFPPLTTLIGLPGSFGTNTTDGFWCLSKAFGSQGIFQNGTYLTGYTRGRTSTHEIGHYLGLRHTWGDANCATDYCDDTPIAKTSNFGSPNYPLNAVGSNSCSGAINGSMFMDFMDYTDDPAKYMFTVDQATRIQAAMLSSPYRKFLGTHNLCSLNSVAAISQFNMSNSFCQGALITLTNTSSGNPIPSYNWTASGNATFIPNNTVATPSINFPSFGNYTVSLSVNNGTLSTYSKTISIYQKPILILNTPTTVCKDDLVTIVATGGTSYIWLPWNDVGDTISYSANTNQSFTCTATNSQGCKTTDSITVFVQECLAINDLNSNHNRIQFFPNPANEKLTVYYHASADYKSVIKINNSLGNIIYEKQIWFIKNKNELQINIEDFNRGIYSVWLKDENGLIHSFKFIKE